MRKKRNNFTLEAIRNGIDSSKLSDALKDLAHMRLDFAEEYIDNNVNISSIIRPGRIIIVDLCDGFIEKDEALGLFVFILKVSRKQGTRVRFSISYVFDESLSIF